MTTKLATILADFTTNLATAIAVAGTTATLQSATDDDGIALPSGQYFFTIDGGNSGKEHFVCTLSGTSLTAISSISRQGVQTSGAVRPHRIGATVSLTDFAHILYMNDMLKGTTKFNASVPLEYDGTASITLPNQLATKAYVDGVAIAGGADASTTVKGISKLSVAPASPTSPIAVGDNDGRVPTQAENDAMVGDNTDIAVGTGNKFVTQTGLQKQAESYAASATGNDTYVVTLSPIPTSYVNGMVVRVKVDVGNTGPATLNVNSLGAITIKKSHDQDLATGDIEAGQLIVLVYNSTGPVFEMISQLASAPFTPGGQSLATAGQTLSAGNPLVTLAYPALDVLFDAKTSFNFNSTSSTTSFTVGNNSNRILIIGAGTITGGRTISTITYNGVGMTRIARLTGGSGLAGVTDLWYLLAPATGANNLVVTLSGSDTCYVNVHSYYNALQQAPETPVTGQQVGTVSASVVPLTNGGVVFGIAMSNSTVPTGSVYTNNTINNTNLLYTSDSGAIYPPSLQTITAAPGGGGTYNAIVASIAPLLVGSSARVYKSSAATAITANSFVGFAQGSATVGTSVTVLQSGSDANQSGLTIGAYYYLADAVATLGLSAGTVTRKVGLALSATEILITNIW